MHASAGDLLQIYDQFRSGTTFDPTIRVYDLAGNVLGSHIGSIAPPHATSLTQLLRLNIRWDDYYYVAVSAPGNTTYDPFRTESGTASAGSEYAISISLRKPSAPLG